LQEAYFCEVEEVLLSQRYLKELRLAVERHGLAELVRTAELGQILKVMLEVLVVLNAAQSD
jgi:hypothetical protein